MLVLLYLASLTAACAFVHKVRPRKSTQAIDATNALLQADVRYTIPCLKNNKCEETCAFFGVCALSVARAASSIGPDKLG